MKRIINGLFMILTFIVLLLWLKFPDSIQWEAIIGIIIILKEVIIHRQMKKIASLEFTPALSLAHGYVNNFLEPAIIELLKKDGANVKFHIYIPEDLEELSDHQIDRNKSKLQSMGFQLREIKLKRKTGRPHDILLVEKQKDSISYFDFPRTLLSLRSFIDYKIESKRNESADSEKQSLGTNLVTAFKEEVMKLVEKKNLSTAVDFVDKSLDIS